MVNYDSSIVNKVGASLTDDVIVAIYNCHMFIVQATIVIVVTVFLFKLAFLTNKLECLAFLYLSVINLAKFACFCRSNNN